MSTKIWHAFRCPAKDFNNVLDKARAVSLGMVEEYLEHFMAQIKEEALGECPKHFLENGKKDIWERSKRLDKVLDLCIEAAKSSYIDPFDIECGYNIWFHENYAYFIPIFPTWMLRKWNSFILKELPDCCEEYHYQNQSDAPEDISEKEWDERRKNWDKVCIDNNHNDRRLYHEIISAKSELDLFDLRWKMARKDVHKALDEMK